MGLFALSWYVEVLSSGVAADELCLDSGIGEEIEEALHSALILHRVDPHDRGTGDCERDFVRHDITAINGLNHRMNEVRGDPTSSLGDVVLRTDLKGVSVRTRFTCGQEPPYSWGGISGSRDDCGIDQIGRTVSPS